MFKKQYLGFLLIGAGAVTAAIAVWMLLKTPGDRAFLSILLFLAVVSAISGTLILFTRLLDRGVNRFLEQLGEDMGEGIEETLAGRRTHVTWLIVSTGILFSIVMFLVVLLHKAEAKWGGIPVWIWGVGVAVVMAFILINLRWYQDVYLPTPGWIFLIPAGALVLSLIVGMNTEDPRSFSMDVRSQPVYNVNPQSVGGDIFDLGSSIDFPSCDEDFCAIVILVIVLVAVAVILVSLSATVSHFWFFSAIILLAIMGVIILKEIRVRREVVAVRKERELDAKRVTKPLEMDAQKPVERPQPEDPFADRGAEIATEWAEPKDEDNT